MPARLNLTGQRFGLLTACEPAPRPASDRKGNTWWTCVCECGERIAVRATHLRAKQTHSCGCVRRFDLWGHRFGRLVVVDRSAKQLDGLSRWVCECDCGSPAVLRDAWQLRSGDTISCGCALREAQAKFGERATAARRGRQHDD